MRVKEILEAFLSGEKGRRVRILTARKGAKRKLVEMARSNAKLALKERMSRRMDDETVLEEARRQLHLMRLPRRVEAFDISNTSGTLTVASMVVWENNAACKQDYRKFKIRSVDGPDDFRARSATSEPRGSVASSTGVSPRVRIALRASATQKKKL